MHKSMEFLPYFWWNPRQESRNTLGGKSEGERGREEGEGERGEREKRGKEIERKISLQIIASTDNNHLQVAGENKS